VNVLLHTRFLRKSIHSIYPTGFPQDNKTISELYEELSIRCVVVLFISIP